MLMEDVDGTVAAVAALLCMGIGAGAIMACAFAVHAGRSIPNSASAVHFTTKTEAAALPSAIAFPRSIIEIQAKC
jgi:hypothetical protein